MASIQASPHPLAFAVAELPANFRAPPCPEDPLALSLRTTARALEGMQKEAVVAGGINGTAWRFVCDEGPYLKGTDLAPFPLGFFCAGMVSCYMTELVRAASATASSSCSRTTAMAWPARRWPAP